MSRTVHLDVFFAQNPLFTTRDIARFLATRGSDNPQTRQALLRYHQSRGRIRRIRRGVYLTALPGSTPSVEAVSPLLVAAKLTEDAILAYHSALVFHGIAHSLRTEHCILTFHSQRTFLRQDALSVRLVAHPAALKRQGKTDALVETHRREGVTMRVTSRERTLVDCLDRPELCGGWEEIWRSFEAVGFLEIRQVVDYALLRGQRRLCALTGYFLDTHREELFVDEQSLSRLREHLPRAGSPAYMDRSLPGSLVADWSLIVPTLVRRRLWDEEGRI